MAGALFPRPSEDSGNVNEIMRIDPAAFFIFDRFKTQEMFEKAN